MIMRFAKLQKKKKKKNKGEQKASFLIFIIHCESNLIKEKVHKHRREIVICNEPKLNKLVL
jgi:hypothetical protein